MIKTVFNYQEEELIDFFLFQLKKKDKVKWFYYLSSGAFLIGGGVVSFGFNQYLYGLMMMIAAIIMFLIYPLRVKKTAQRAASSRYKREPQEFIFEDNCVCQYVDQKKIIYHYDKIKEVDETNNYIYFYLNKQAAIIVNKNHLEVTDYEGLIEIIKKNNLIYYKYNY